MSSSNRTDVSVFLPSSRSFPTDDLEQLAVELNKAYTDTALQVNQRSTGIFSESNVQTGETWYVQNEQEQTLRKTFPFTGASTISHGLAFSSVTRIFGTYLDSIGIWHDLGDADVTATVGSTNVNIVVGGGAPAIVRGFVTVEYF